MSKLRVPHRPRYSYNQEKTLLWEATIAMKHYRLEVKIRNNALLEALEARGFTACSFAKQYGLSPAILCGLAAMKYSPLLSDGFYRREVLKILEVTGIPFDKLFNEQQANEPLPTNKRSITMDKPEIDQLTRQRISWLLPHDSTIDVESYEIVKDVNVLLNKAKLSKREMKVLHDRFVEKKTYKECGKDDDVTGERIRQIEGNALRKLLIHSRE